MSKKYILIFIFLFKISYNIYVYRPNLFFEYLEEEKVDKSDLDNIITKISDGFEEAYAFLPYQKILQKQIIQILLTIKWILKKN